MPWWMWMIFGLVLMILEVQAFGGFFLMFFGIGAMLVGFLVAVGAVATDWLAWLLFSVLSFTALALLRRTVVQKLSPGAAASNVDSLIGQVAVASEAIASSARGKAELRGSSWNVHNSGPTPLASGQRCRVEQVDGLTLRVRAE